MGQLARALCAECGVLDAWDDGDQLVTDPETEISLIWYGNKGEVEDRVFRSGTERSIATSLP
jgi:benzoate/toluate 1,2-dioxygenase beta subunit